MWKIRGKAQVCTAATMLIVISIFILYRLTPSDSRSHAQMPRGNSITHKSHIHHEHLSAAKLEEINVFSTITQSPVHLAKQKAYEARIMADVRLRAQEGHTMRRLYPHNDHQGENIIRSKEMKIGPALFKGDRIVHLDLKGAPPRMGYYEEFFPLLKSLGATGILIEYEDMFPYSGNQLQDFPAYNAYSKSDIKLLLKLASTNGLIVIPLIQTFGHMEFILKLQKYAELREVHQYPQVICPTHNTTFGLLTAMIDQIIESHPGIKYLHIGCDEVYYLGECVRCGLAMVDNNWSKTQLFLHHVTKLAKYIRSKHPGVVPLVWDDEFRQLSEAELKSWGVAELLEPVVWKYTPHVSSYLVPEIWEKYATVFPAVWIASAFKGATGPNKYITNISYHLENHQSWMEIVASYSDKLKFRGLVLTGWQRYDHFAILCELLPVGIPSLAVNLAYVQSDNKDMTSVPQSVMDKLKCDSTLPLGPGMGRTRCSYSGAALLDGVERLYTLQQNIDHLMMDSTVLGWLHPYNIKHGFSNPSYVEHATVEVDRCKMELVYIERDITAAMADIYDSFTTSEWVETYIKPIDTQLQQLWEAKEKLLAKEHWPKRPFDILKMKENEF